MTQNKRDKPHKNYGIRWDRFPDDYLVQCLHLELSLSILIRLKSFWVDLGHELSWIPCNCIKASSSQWSGPSVPWKPPAFSFFKSGGLSPVSTSHWLSGKEKKRQWKCIWKYRYILNHEDNLVPSRGVRCLLFKSCLTSDRGKILSLQNI